MNKITGYFWGSKPQSAELQKLANLPEETSSPQVQERKVTYIYAMEVMALGSMEIASVVASGWLAASINILSGSGMTIYGIKGVITNITKLNAEIQKPKEDRSTFLLLSSAFKTTTYAVWILTGLGSLAYGIGFFLPTVVSGLQTLVQILPYANIVAAAGLVLMKTIDLYVLYQTDNEQALIEKQYELQSSLALLCAAVFFTASDTLAPGATFAILIMIALYAMICDLLKKGI